MSSVPAFNAWARLAPMAEFGGLAGLFATETEWRIQQQDVDGLGLLDIGSVIDGAITRGDVEQRPLPQLRELYIDLHVRGEIRIVRIAGDDTAVMDPEVLAESVFDDPHPKEWIAELEQTRRAVLAIAPRGPGAFSTMQAWQRTWRVGVVGVASRIDVDGVGGIVRPSCDVCDAHQPEWIQHFNDGTSWLLCGACVNAIRRGRQQRLIDRSNRIPADAEAMLAKLQTADGPPRQRGN